jgi:hypothetical protein
MPHTRLREQALRHAATLDEAEAAFRAEYVKWKGTVESLSN